MMDSMTQKAGMIAAAAFGVVLVLVWIFIRFSSRASRGF